MAFTIENHFPNNAVYGVDAASGVRVFEGGTNTSPTNIIHEGQPAIAHFRWKQVGFLANLIIGHWHCDFFAERLGPDAGPAFPTKYVPSTLGDGFTNTVNIDLSGLPKGSYHCVAAVGLYSNVNDATPIHMMEDVGIIRVV